VSGAAETGRHRDPGPEPELAWVPVAAIEVDARYQRPVGDAGRRRIRAIVRGFRWPLFGALTLARRDGAEGAGPDGPRYACLDGQHRLAAAVRLGLARVPAAVVTLDGVAGEAGAFLAANRDRAGVTAYVRWRAELAAGEPTAAALARALAAAGWRAGNGAAAGQLGCVAMLRRVLARSGEAALTTALTALRQARPAEPPVYPLLLRQLAAFVAGGRAGTGYDGDAGRLAAAVARLDLPAIAGLAAALKRVGDYPWKAWKAAVRAAWQAVPATAREDGDGGGGGGGRGAEHGGAFAPHGGRAAAEAGDPLPCRGGAPDGDGRGPGDGGGAVRGGERGAGRRPGGAGARDGADPGAGGRAGGGEAGAGSPAGAGGAAAPAAVDEPLDPAPDTSVRRAPAGAWPAHARFDRPGMQVAPPPKRPR